MSVLPLCDPPDDLEMAQPFWEAVNRCQLVLPRCSVCGRWQWYPEADGTDCAGGTLIWQQVPLAGTVYTFTRVHRSFLPGGHERVPYAVGLVDLDGVDGPRLVATLDDSAELAVGARVRARFDALGERLHVVFAPASSDCSQHAAITAAPCSI